MKNRTVLLALCFIALSAVSFAQKKTELKVKVVKSENGETITIDTTLNSEDSHVYFYSDGDGNQEKVDSILKSLGIEASSSVEFINSKLKDIDAENAHVWITTSGDCEKFDIRIDGDAKVIESKKCITFVSGDDTSKTKKDFIYYTNDNFKYETDEEGNKILIARDSESESHVWTVHNSEGAKVIRIGGDADISSNVKVIGGDDDGVQVSEVIIKKGEGDCKTIEIMIDGDNLDGDEEIIELENALEGSGQKVKIIKYNTEDGMLVVKAEILDCELNEEDQEKVKDLGIEDDNELELKKFKLYPNPTEGVFNIEFEIENKESTTINVYNDSGKVVYKDKIKKFDGFYSTEIDIAKEKEGIYFVKIIQGKKSITKKVMKK